MRVKMYLNMLELLHLFSSTFGEVHVQECVVGQVWWSTVDDGVGHVQREVGMDFAVQRCRGVPSRLLGQIYRKKRSPESLRSSRRRW
jgi:hypothetical protein